jgi:putative ABC transport system permease protein
VRELRQAWRALFAQPGFTAAAVITLALGIGATTAIFSVVHGVLLRPLPYREPDRLVWTGGSLPDLEDVSGRTRVFAGLAMTASNVYAADVGGPGAVQLRGDVVTPGFFDVLGVQPALGRTFTREEETSRVVVIADRLWRQSYGAERSVLGRTLRLNSKVYTIIGVMPPSLRLPSPKTVLWTPLEEALIGWPERGNRRVRIAQAFARLAPGVELPAACMTST